MIGPLVLGHPLVYNSVAIKSDHNDLTSFVLTHFAEFYHDRSSSLGPHYDRCLWLPPAR
jgi:hypothetical protein